MAQITANRRQPPPFLRIGPFGGIDLSTDQAQIDQNKSPDMMNFYIDDRGSLNKRTGYERIFPNSLGEGKINGLYEYRKKDGTVLFLIAHGTNLYTQSGDLQPVSIYSSLANQSATFYTMNDKCYIMDGVNFLVYDGSTVLPVVPYIPTLSVSKDPSGGGTKLEDFNLLGAGFKDSFSPDGTATVFQLSLTGLDATPITALDSNVEKVEGTHFTVDRTTGKVTFTTAPVKGTNSLIITAYKTFAEKPNHVKKCRFHVLFGGSNDTRVFISGNPDFPNQIWRSGLYEPSYWPENGFYKIGSDSDRIQGFSKQYDYLVIHKEFSLWNMQYQLTNGEASFPIKPINDQVGTFAKGTIQIIENNPVSLSREGVYMLMASNVRDERNVKHFSFRVDKRLLREPNLKDAISVEYDKKYWIAINDNVYIYDYVIDEWYLYDNIKASCFIERNGELYFGCSCGGLVYKFKEESHLQAFEDDGEIPINAYWVSKLFVFGLPEFKKIVQRLFVEMKPNKHTSVNVYARSDRKGETFILNTRMDQFDFNYMDFGRFAFVTSDIPQEVGKKVKMKKITHFQLKLENNSIDESLGIMGLSIKYGLQNEVK
ncbi:hypothetical protein ACFYKX_26565 [Cytobacillus sp. FJAT-54145]|uniref:Uncharacterized protein n=1 Tax=Cytobacillus spartinae TaxID=3299023 RepID=A0ABW6KLK9_9BACI